MEATRVEWVAGVIMIMYVYYTYNNQFDADQLSLDAYLKYVLQSNHKDGGRNKWMLIDEVEEKNCARQISPETNQIIRLPLKLSPASNSLFLVRLCIGYSQR